jgi:hypothetical protein
MARIARLGIEVALLVATASAVLPGGAEASVHVGSDVRLFGATAAQVELSGWAVNRYEIARLHAPAVEIHFHDDVSACGGYWGWAQGGRIDFCTSDVDAKARRAILHEMGHIWLDEHLTPSVRERFIALRGLSDWNAASDPWRLRAYEQGAEVLAWGVGERIVTPSIPDNGPVQLASAFRLLTGAAPPGPIEAAAEHAPSSHKGVTQTPPWCADVTFDFGSGLPTRADPALRSVLIRSHVSRPFGISSPE